MTKQKSTKRALLSSAIALMVCVAMLIGTTFAWFTDSVTSSGNIIQSGKLKIAFEWADGDEALDSANWQDASAGAIFDYDLWEPGYVQARHLKISNVGSLALKYQMQILANGVVSELADVIDVYFFEEAIQTTRASFTDANKLGVLSDVINVSAENSLVKKIQGKLLAEDGQNVDTVTIAFKMQESAGNEYQGLSIGSDFSVRLFATQLTKEEDSFDENYDKDAKFPAQKTPSAVVKKLSAEELNSVKIMDNDGVKLDTGYQFVPSEILENIEGTKYAKWHADYVVYADKKVPADSMMLAGYYKLFDDFMNLNGAWIGLSSSEDIAAGTPIRLLNDGLNVSINYTEICEFGNDGIGFLCGAADVTGENAGTTLTVELRLYETEAPSESNGNSSNVETGNYIVIGTFTHVFGGNYEADEKGAVYFYGDDGVVVLDNIQDVTASTYAIQEGTSILKDGIFAWNSNITEVEIPASVTSFGSSTGAFKNSNVETVVLEEGITAIPDYAFNQAKKLDNFNIPSTVTSIGKNAFRTIASTDLVIPATVETLGEGAFRDMPNVKTVTIEGNTTIGNFAFRECAQLQDVYLNGEDVKFAPGCSIVFSLNQSGNANGQFINIHVKNETVAARVKAAQTSTQNYKIFVNGVAYN